MTEALVADDFKAVAVDRRNAGRDAGLDLGLKAGMESIGFDGHDEIPPNTVQSLNTLSCENLLSIRLF